jgi:hypothetical protein
MIFPLHEAPLCPADSIAVDPDFGTEVVERWQGLVDPGADGEDTVTVD